jgi:hypothetical protein
VFALPQAQLVLRDRVFISVFLFIHPPRQCSWRDKGEKSKAKKIAPFFAEAT